MRIVGKHSTFPTDLAKSDGNTLQRLAVIKDLLEQNAAGPALQETPKQNLFWPSSQASRGGVSGKMWQEQHVILPKLLI